MIYSERLDILEQGDVIKTQIKELAEKVIEQLEIKYPIDWSLETSMMFATHAAIAIKRMVEGEPLTDIPDEVRDEISKEKEVLKDLTIIMKDTCKDVQVTEEEIMLIASYIKVIKKS